MLLPLYSFTHKYRSGRLLKLSSCLLLRYLWVNDYKGNGISCRDHYILVKCAVRHRLHSLVLTDTYLYNFMK